MRVRRSTIRWRLTAFYGFVFILCGALLLFVSYLLVRASLLEDEGTTAHRVVSSYGYTPEQVTWFYSLPVPPPEAGAGCDGATAVGHVIQCVQGDIRDDALKQMVVGSSVALLAMVGISVAVGWLAAGRVLRPVGELTRRAQDLSDENLHARIGLDGPNDELKVLADTLDGMLARMEVSFEAQRALASHVSHELRTPLAIIRGEADLALAQPDLTDREEHLAISVRAATERTEALLDSLLALARSESTMGDRSVVDLAELAGDVVSERIDRADAAEVTLDLELGAGEVEGDRWLLERLVANLVDNGITHNNPGGWLRVAVCTTNAGVVVRTSNTGDRVSPEQVSEIMQPFQRLTDSRRPGHGLGMTIVQSVARAHGGSVDLFPRVAGGLDVEVTLPAYVRSREQGTPPVGGRMLDTTDPPATRAIRAERPTDGPPVAPAPRPTTASSPGQLVR